MNLPLEEIIIGALLIIVAAILAWHSLKEEPKQ